MVDLRAALLGPLCFLPVGGSGGSSSHTPHSRVKPPLSFQALRSLGLASPLEDIIAGLLSSSGPQPWGRSLTLGRCLLLLLFLLSLPIPEAGERGWGEGGCIQSAKAGPRPWPGPTGREGWWGCSGYGGRQWGEAEMRWEVTEKQLKPAGLPAMRKREEG